MQVVSQKKIKSPFHKNVVRLEMDHNFPDFAFETDEYKGHPKKKQQSKAKVQGSLKQEVSTADYKENRKRKNGEEKFTLESSVELNSVVSRRS